MDQRFALQQIIKKSLEYAKEVNGPTPKGEGAGGPGPSNSHAWPPNQLACSFKESGFCA